MMDTAPNAQPGKEKGAMVEKSGAVHDEVARQARTYLEQKYH